MAEVIRMPLLSDTMTEGKIVKWNRNIGDATVFFIEDFHTRV